MQLEPAKDARETGFVSREVRVERSASGQRPTRPPPPKSTCCQVGLKILEIEIKNQRIRLNFAIVG